MNISPFALSHLNAMFGYNTPVPDVPVTYSFRMDKSDPWKDARSDVWRQKVKSSYAPPKKTGLSDGQKRLLMIVKCNTKVTPMQVAKKTGWTQNHCSSALAALCKAKLIKRNKTVVDGYGCYEYFKI